MKPEDIYSEIKHIEGWFSSQDVVELSKLKLPAKPIILELGTKNGRSARAMKFLWPDADITTCDLSIANVVGTTGVKYIQISSLELDWDDDIDLLFIDSSHTYEQTKLEIEKFKPFVKKGGYIVCHDYYGTGVGDAVDEQLPGSIVVQTGEYSMAVWRNK